ncbi:hypothetical protein ACWEIJ_24260 [Lentzea sp. NPDC004789]
MIRRLPEHRHSPPADVRPRDLIPVGRRMTDHLSGDVRPRELTPEDNE